jgi:hypothetical protein
VPQTRADAGPRFISTGQILITKVFFLFYVEMVSFFAQLALATLVNQAIVSHKKVSDNPSPMLRAGRHIVRAQNKNAHLNLPGVSYADKKSLTALATVSPSPAVRLISSQSSCERR